MAGFWGYTERIVTLLVRDIHIYVLKFASEMLHTASFRSIYIICFGLWLKTCSHFYQWRHHCLPSPMWDVGVFPLIRKQANHHSQKLLPPPAPHSSFKLETRNCVSPFTLHYNFNPEASVHKRRYQTSVPSSHCSLLSNQIAFPFKCWWWL